MKMRTSQLVALVIVLSLFTAVKADASTDQLTCIIGILPQFSNLATDPIG